MTIRDILVQVDDAPASAHRVGVAATLAASRGAHLVGLCLFGPPPIPAAVEAQLPESVIRDMQVAARATAKAAEDRFRRDCAAAGITHEWRQVETAAPAAAAIHARYADLSVIGQDDPDRPGPLDGMAEEVVLASGRPTLVVPYVGRFAALGANVLIAWNGSREASRAVHDALPLFRKDARITILALNPESTAAGGAGVPGADIALHLARHGHKVEATHFVSDEISVGDMLLSRAADLGADLIVMGAYGHSRLREIVLGGVTRHLLRHMTVPVLMSH
ncbi:MAG: universal stress protein [Alphaproteobacteria bacterium]